MVTEFGIGSDELLVLAEQLGAGEGHNQFAYRPGQYLLVPPQKAGGRREMAPVV